MTINKQPLAMPTNPKLPTPDNQRFHPLVIESVAKQLGIKPDALGVLDPQSIDDLISAGLELKRMGLLLEKTDPPQAQAALPTKQGRGPALGQRGARDLDPRDVF